MYLFFGLNEKPFAITPDPRYLYLSERHAEALAHLVYGINEAGGFVQLTGEVGTGKTTIIRSLLAQVPKHAEVALILNPRMTPAEFLLTLCEELGIGVPDSAQGSIKDLVDILSHYLLRAHANGKRIVLVVDEAQNLAPEVLEQVRLLTNLETETQKLLQIILIGQPELRELLGRTELRQLAQRITGRYHLAPLSGDGTAAYVRHRLRVAGATSDPFTPGALREVYRLSQGVPRVINVICDRALLGAYTQDHHHVTAGLVRRAAGEVFGRRFAPSWLPWMAATVALALFAGSGAGAWWYLLGRHTEVHAPAAASAASPPVAAPANPPAAEVPPPELFASLLAKYPNETDTDNAFNKLFALWGLRYVAGGTDPCTQAARAGLECLMQRGSLAELRLFNRPAVLLLSDETGASHQVVLTALDGERGRVDLGGAQRPIGIGDLSRYWFGDYILLWRRGPGQSKDLSLGMRGEEVRWLRQSLERLAGLAPAEPPSELFDSQLAQLVKDFQRRHRLTADGIAGLQTRIMLDTALAAPDTPWLQVPATSQGG
ncbi:MAG: AAA family ATPase [Gammaproteobacteria bacterium]|nr:AAA family ATPase [Gammaproteobacteria bacterium]